MDEYTALTRFREWEYSIFRQVISFISEASLDLKEIPNLNVAKQSA